jgi:hypothetical protein
MWLRGIEIPSGYRVDYRLLPNLGGDLVIPLLMMVFSPSAAGKLFLMLAAFVFWLGSAIYIRQVAKPGAGTCPASLLLLPLVIGGAFYWGNLNYYSGIGLAFLALAHQDWMIRRKTASPLHLLLHAACVSLLFLWHLADWTIYGVLAGCRLAVELTHTSRGSEAENDPSRVGTIRIAGVAATVLPSLVLLYLYKANPAEGSAVDFNLQAQVLWNDLPRKAIYILGVFRSYDWWIDLVVAGLWAAALLAWFRFGRPSTPTRLTTPILGLGLLLIFYIFIPYELGTTSAADTRLIPAILVCTLAVVAGMPIRRPLAGACLLASCLIVRHVEIYQAWSRLGNRLDRYAEAFRFISPGSRILPINIPSHVSSKEQPEHHFHCWAVIEKNVFDPLLFAHAGQFVLRRSFPESYPMKIDLSNCNSNELSRSYDYLWIMNLESQAMSLPPGLDPIYIQGSLTLCRIIR